MLRDRIFGMMGGGGGEVDWSGAYMHIEDREVLEFSMREYELLSLC